MTVELADYLIGLDKQIVKDGKLLDSYLIDITYPMNFRLMLSSPDDLEQNLMIDVKESAKSALKISLHHQDDNSQNGLLRVDYNSRHKNPEEVIDTLPTSFHPFAGCWLDDYAGHIHYVVDGYKPLAWAIPLENDEFPIKELGGREDYAATLQAFFDKINVKTTITFNTQMRIV